jgi:transcription factor STE12
VKDRIRRHESTISPSCSVDTSEICQSGKVRKQSDARRNTRTEEPPAAEESGRDWAPPANCRNPRTQSQRVHCQTAEHAHMTPILEPHIRSTDGSEAEGMFSRCFPSQYLLVDSPVKVFECPLDFCRRAFRRLEHLKRHVRTHTRERPYICRYCGRPFSRQDNLLQHVRIHKRSGFAAITDSQPMRDHTSRTPETLTIRRSASEWPRTGDSEDQER